MTLGGAHARCRGPPTHPATHRRISACLGYSPRQRFAAAAFPTANAALRDRVITQKASPKLNKYHSCRYRAVDSCCCVCRGLLSTESTHS
ncbi:hypothetical protein B5X24_HaOG207719 [Helicoverpa armigera]|uniref:Uncharacterized protein n=1 Tax=Helicoverpa armigera TaxID=29058 RepID=A0A2W1BNS4_HELAM|nr:hypothetical protein B5X24_HaOG207719 [Helicoverpa armigera]